MGIIYEKLGDTSSALKYLNEANNLSPENSFGEKINKVFLNFICYNPPLNLD